jgi:hypothetical protein
MKEPLKGKKTFLVALVSAVLAGLMAFGVITEEYAQEVQIALAGVIGATLRLAVGKK